MIRLIITINPDLCDGCGICVSACHEGAIGIVDGKAKLLRDDYCDGLGDCLSACPTNAITFETRDALEFNAAEVKKNLENQKISSQNTNLPCGCPSTNTKTIQHPDEPTSTNVASVPSYLNQ